MITIEEARKIIFSDLYTPDIINVNLLEGQDYYLAEDIKADRDYPPFDRAAVDGFAVSSNDLNSGMLNFLISETIFSGDHSTYSYKQGECVKIMTGAAVPAGLDVIFKVEDCEFNNGIFKYTGQKFKPGMNVSNRGENCKKGDVIVSRGAKIDYRTAHSLAATGNHNISVWKPPTVTIISTGSEVVGMDAFPLPNQIRDSNYPGLTLAFSRFNIRPTQYFLVNDSRKEISDAIQEGLKSDILIVSGGVSMGDADFVPEILIQSGVEKKFHNVCVKPGKPLFFGVNGSKKVFALPGNPLSSLVSYKLFIEPFLQLSLAGSKNESMFLPVTQDRILKGDRTEYFPVKLVNIDGKTWIEPLSFHGSGDITATIGSDAIACHLLESREIKKGDMIEVILWQ